MLRASRYNLPSSYQGLRLRLIRSYASEGSAKSNESKELVKDDVNTTFLQSSRMKRGRVRAPSKFQVPSRVVSKAVTKSVDKGEVTEAEKSSTGTEYVKSPETIRREIREKYGNQVPEAFISEMIEESQAFNATLKANTREDGTIDMQRINQEDLKTFLDYVDTVIKRFYLELDEYEQDDVGKQEDEETFMSKLVNAMNPANMVGNINKGIDAVADKMAEYLRPTAREDLVALIKAVGENPRKSNQDIPLQLQSRLFNCAIRLPPGPELDLCLYITGNIIYLNKGLRADPFNEARYINTLIDNGNFVQAEYLWHSRLKKDVKDRRFWEEIGIKILISAKNQRKAVLLANDILSKYGYISVPCVVELIKLYLRKPERKKALEWVKVFDDIMSEQGFDEEFKPRQVAVDLSEVDDQEGFKELDKTDPVRFEDVYMVVATFLYAGQHDIAVQLISKYIKLIPNIEHYLLYKFSEMPQDVQAGLYYTASSEPGPLQQSLKAVLTVSSKSELELKQMVFRRLVQLKSPLLSSEDAEVTLSSEDCFSIIKDFTSRGMHKEVTQLLGYMQDVKHEKDKGSTVKYAFPPVKSYHYIPILQKLGRHKSKDVIARAEKLLQIMNKWGVRRDVFFQTQYLLTLYRKREFKYCIDHVKETIISRNKTTKSSTLLDTIWTIYRDANKASRETNGVKLTYEEIFNLVEYTLQCYKFRPPSTYGAYLVLETLIATKNIPLAMIYIQSFGNQVVLLDQPGYLKLHNLLLELVPPLSLSTEERKRVTEMIKDAKASLLSRSRSAKLQSYDIRLAYHLIYYSYLAFSKLDPDFVEEGNLEVAKKLNSLYIGSEKLLEIAKAKNATVP